MLSQYERRQLEQIERALELTEPALVHRFRRGPAVRLWPLAAVGVFGLVVFAFGLVILNAGTAFLGVAIATGGLRLVRPST